MHDFQMIDVWNYGDFVTRSVAIILLLMSIASWSMIVIGCLRSLRFNNQTKNSLKFWDKDTLTEATNSLTDPGSPWKVLALEGRYAADGFDQKASDKSNLNAKADWILRSLANVIDNYAIAQSRGLNLLSSIGATAPFVGLFGTVWGIYHTLLALSSSSQMTIDQVAGPIGEALVMTAFGLAVAIPAVWGNNALAGGNKKRLEIIGAFAQELQTFLVTGQKPLGRTKSS